MGLATTRDVAVGALATVGLGAAGKATATVVSATASRYGIGAAAHIATSAALGVEVQAADDLVRNLYGVRDGPSSLSTYVQAATFGAGLGIAGSGVARLANIRGGFASNTKLALESGKRLVTQASQRVQRAATAVTVRGRQFLRSSGSSIRRGVQTIKSLRRHIQSRQSQANQAIEGSARRSRSFDYDNFGSEFDGPHQLSQQRSTNQTKHPPAKLEGYNGPWYDRNATGPPGGGTWAEFIEGLGGGSPPIGGPINHGHHIFLKRGRGAKGRAIAKEGQAILQEMGIDPIIGLENLTHAPLHGVGIHSRATQLEILEGLKSLKAQGAPREQFVLLLQKFGKRARNASVNSR